MNFPVAQSETISYLPSWGWPLIAFFIAALVTIGVVPSVRKFAIAKGAVDDPKRDDRRVHVEPIPRWGGVGIFVGILASCLVLPAVGAVPLAILGTMVATLVLVYIGTIDDMQSFSARRQAVIMLVAAIGVQFVFAGSPNEPRVFIERYTTPILGNPTGYAYFPVVVSVFLTFVYLFVVTKTMDTIDGVDGLASGLSAIAAISIAIVTALGVGGSPHVVVLSAGVAGACIGFLRWNWNPAKIFMGTGGSQGLGFLLACLSIVGPAKVAGGWSWFVPFLIFSVPLVDAIQVTIRRLRAGVPIYVGDKRHLHHQLLNRGLGAKKTVIVLYLGGLMTSSILIIAVANRG